MLALLLYGGVGFAALLYVIVIPVVSYFYDAKGLRKYPNFSPFSGITDLRHCYLSACGYRSKDLYLAHKETKEPILRTGPNSLSFGDVRAIKDLYGHATKCIKDRSYTLVGGTHAQIFDVVDKADHARKRKYLSAGFALKNLERWEFKVACTTKRLLDGMDKYCTAPLPLGQTTPDPADVTLDFGEWIYFFTIEAINSIALSSRMDLMDKGSDVVTAERKDGSTYQARYREAQNYMTYGQATFVWDYKHFTLLTRLSKLSPKWRDVWRKAAPWGDIVYHQAATRLRRYLAGEQLDDFFSALMEDKQGKPNNLEWGEIVAEVGALINAGADTTSIALTNVLEMLLHHPEDLQKLRQEVGGVLDEDEVVAPYDKVKNLPFLRACLDEGLRLSPPTSAGLPRRTPPEGAQIMDQWIPGDTSVSMTIYATHRDPEIFPDPEEYRPQRWMDPESRKRMEPYFIPFSAGARGCLGRNISYLEQTVVLASIVHRYEFALPSPDFELSRQEAFNLLVGELPIKIWRR
ncbi:cytochrome P450 [Aspergillus parasiticus]|uniref:Cytochrome P450 n=1 Tax=Aspergillus parasiticus TaxID=5067 RepID=A0A5N6DH74_ASPPA|nr:cytochrome P450 [Aspergillus parasiticus]